jgi:hypothetical protein
MLHPINLSSEYPLFGVRVFERSQQVGIQLVNVPLNLDVFVLVHLKVFHALLNNFPEGLKVNVEVSLYWSRYLLDYILYKLALDFIDLRLGVNFVYLLHLGFHVF